MKKIAIDVGSELDKLESLCYDSSSTKLNVLGKFNFCQNLMRLHLGSVPELEDIYDEMNFVVERDHCIDEYFCNSYWKDEFIGRMKDYRKIVAHYLS